LTTSCYSISQCSRPNLIRPSSHQAHCNRNTPLYKTLLPLSHPRSLPSKPSLNPKQQLSHYHRLQNLNPHLHYPSCSPKHFECRNWTPVPARGADSLVYSRIECIIKIWKIGMMSEIFPCDDLICRGTQKKATGKCTLHTYSWLRMTSMNAQRCISDIDIQVVRV